MKFVENLFNIMQDNCKTVKFAKKCGKVQTVNYSNYSDWIFIWCQQFRFSRKFYHVHKDLLLFKISAVDLTHLLGSNKQSEIRENSENSNLILHKIQQIFCCRQLCSFCANFVDEKWKKNSISAQKIIVFECIHRRTTPLSLTRVSASYWIYWMNRNVDLINCRSDGLREKMNYYDCSNVLDDFFWKLFS